MEIIELSGDTAPGIQPLCFTDHATQPCLLKPSFTRPAILAGVS
jgi:hypothetical protein